MKKKKNTKFRADDFLVVIICLFSFLFFMFRFHADLNQTLTKQNERPVATIVFKERSAQRKFSDRILWDRLKVESPLYNQDTIHTEDMALASIKFPSNAQIDLNGNTLVQISVDKNNEAHIMIASGNVNVNTKNSSAGVVVSNGNNNVHIASGSIATLDAGGTGDGGAAGGFNFQLVDGSASVTTETGGVREISTPGSLNISSAGGITENPAIIVTSPSPNTRFFTANRTDNQLAFLWQKQNIPDDQTIKIQIAEDAKFSNIITETSVSAASNNYFSDLNSGTFFWRVYPESYPENISSGRVAVIYSPPPHLIAPANDALIPLNKTERRVFFSWQKTDGADSYQLVIARDSTLDNVISAVNVPGNSAIITALESAGDYYWRVYPLTSMANAGTITPSAVSHFSLRQEDAENPPQLILPKNGETVSIAKNFKSDFSWKESSYSPNEKYIFALSRNADMSAPVIQKETLGNTFSFSPNENTGVDAGDYYWAVYGQDGGGKRSEVSEIRKITLSQDESGFQNISPPDFYTASADNLPKMHFSWRTRVNSAASVHFQVARDKDFSDIVIDESVRTSSVLGKALGAGDYYWRVASSTEASGGFLLTVREPFAPPAGIEPVSRTEVKAVSNLPVMFRWAEIPEAQNYRFKIFDTNLGMQSRALFESVIEGDNRIEVKPSEFADPVNFAGSYTWTVEAFSQPTDKNSYRSGIPASFIVSIVSATPINMIYPSDGAAFSGLQARNAPGTVQWSASNPVRNTRFILANVPNPLAATGSQILMDITAPPQQIQLPPLEEGAYYWIVTANDANGSNASPPYPFSFSVLPIPLLGAPGGRVPAASAVLGATYFKQNRNIVFSWNPVPGATHYRFSFSLSGSREILASQDSGETRFEFNNLENLDKGRFTWRLEAVEKDENGNITRNGILSENSFIIDLPSLQTPVLTTPDLLYSD